MVVTRSGAIFSNPSADNDESAKKLKSDPEMVRRDKIMCVHGDSWRRVMCFSVIASLRHLTFSSLSVFSAVIVFVMLHFLL